jgi:DNA polymerase delta subunit 1
MSKTADSKDYKAKQAHVELARRMKLRDAGTAPVMGDRVPYVIIKAAKGTPLYMKSEDPIYVLENNLPIDTQYYLDNQLKKPLMRIMEPITNNASEILYGAHTLKVSKPTPKARKGGIMMFAKKKLQCLGCRTPIASGSNEVLCKYCKPKEATIYSQQLLKVHTLEEKFSRLWTQCQRCQGSLHDDVLCTNRDCTIFYMRKTVRKNLDQEHTKLSRFGSVSDW